MANHEVRDGVSRRSVLASSVAAGAALALPAEAAAAIPILDTHIHLYDPNRPQGAPYFGPENSPTHKTGAFPATYAKLARPLGIVGAIEVEASPWVEDNLWVLEQAAGHDIMVGYVGNLKPDAADFGELLGRFHKNPLFRGIRYGNIWGYDLVAKANDKTFLDGLKLLAQADLALDTANQSLATLQATVRVADAVPNLRIVIDHLPAFDPAAADMAAYEAVLRELHARPQIFTKLSEIIHPVGGKTSLEIAPYKARLDHLYETFGEDRVLFGSDWPNSDGVAPVAKVVAVARAYMATKTPAQQTKYFWKNSLAAYKWVRRSPAQKALA
jgi:predicted TIM-barrel fold metal-dependent hydrolase